MTDARPSPDLRVLSTRIYRGPNLWSYEPATHLVVDLGSHAVRHCLARANPGDLVVLCADKHATVLAELERWSQQARAGARAGESVGDPDLDPEEMTEAATNETTAIGTV